MQPPFDKIKGVKKTIVGYTGGQQENPTYEEVCSGGSGHTEAIEVVYDHAQVSYGELLDVFWHSIDPTTPNQQFADVGTQYRTAIFYHNEDQQRLAQESKEKFHTLGVFKKPIVTEITLASTFYPAEDYHQEYYKKDAAHYKFYSAGSGREGFINKTWCPLKK